MEIDSTIELVGIQTPLRKRSKSYSFLANLHTFQCDCQEGELHPNCSMQCKSFSPDTCVNGHFWCHQANICLYMSMDYHSLGTVSPDSNQIDLDLSRTFPDNKFFNSTEGSKVLSRVLNRLAIYLPALGYVQGMNYICASLLWHTSEVNAFWLMVKLMQDYHLSENFADGLPGLMMHCEKVEEYIKEIWPKLYKHLIEYSIVPGMFMTDWCITIFTNVIPIEKIGLFFTYFFQDGWEYFYKLSLEILDRLRKKIMKLDDRQEILSLIKPYQLLATNQERFLNSICLRSEKKNWSKILVCASKRKLTQ